MRVAGWGSCEQGGEQEPSGAQQLWLITVSCNSALCIPKALYKHWLISPTAPQGAE